MGMKWTCGTKNHRTFPLLAIIELGWWLSQKVKNWRTSNTYHPNPSSTLKNADVFHRNESESCYQSIHWRGWDNEKRTTSHVAYLIPTTTILFPQNLTRFYTLTMNSASIRQSLARLALRRQPIHSSRRFSSSELQHEKAQDTLAAAQKLSGKVFENAKKFLEPVGEYTGRLFGCVLYFSFCIIILYVDVLLTHFLPPLFIPGRSSL